MIDKLQEHEYIKNSLFCEQQIIKTLSHHILPNRRIDSSIARKSTAGVLYAVGGMDSSKGKLLTYSFFKLISFLFIPLGITLVSSLFSYKTLLK